MPIAVVDAVEVKRQLVVLEVFVNNLADQLAAMLAAPVYQETAAILHAD